MIEITSDLWLTVTFAGVVLGAAAFFYLAYRWNRAAEQLEDAEFDELAGDELVEMPESIEDRVEAEPELEPEFGAEPAFSPEPVVSAAPVQAQAIDEDVPPVAAGRTVGDLDEVRLVLEGLVRAQVEGFERLERRLDDLERRLSRNEAPIEEESEPVS